MDTSDNPLNDHMNSTDDLKLDESTNKLKESINESNDHKMNQIEDDPMNGTQDLNDESMQDKTTIKTSKQSVESSKDSLDETSKEASSNCEIKHVSDEVEKSVDDEMNSTQANKTKKHSIIIVHLLNGGKFECPITSKSTGIDVFRSTCDYLILREHQYFGLTYRDSHNTRIWINLNKKINKIINDNRNSLHFEVKFFPEPTDLKENITRFFLCLQIRNNMIEEKITCSEETYATLGSYLVQSEFGNYDSNKHNADYLNDFKFAPKPTPKLIERLKELHRERRGMSASEAELLFLQNAKKLSIYGLDFYPAKDSNETQITIGVCSYGLSVYNKESECIEKYPWLKISKIAYTPENFFIKVKSNDESDSTKTENTVNFKLCSKKATHALYKITIDHHTFFKTLSSNNQPASSKHSSKKKRESKSSKHHKKEERSKHHKSEKLKNRKENHIKSSEKSDRKTEKSEKKHRKEERVDTVKESRDNREIKHLKESTKDNNRDAALHQSRHSSSNRHKRKRDDKHSREEDRKQRDSYRDSNRDVVREANRNAIRETNRDTNRESYKETHRESYKETHRESYKESHRESYKESHRESYKEPVREYHRESYKEPHKDTHRESNRDHLSRPGKESRKEERRREYDRDSKYRERRDDRSSERKRHKRKHSKHRKNESVTIEKKKPISIAESHYQSLVGESMKYLNEKIKSKDSKHKKSRKSDHESRSPVAKSNPSSAPKQDDKKASNHFIKDIINLDNELMKDQSNVSNEACPAEKENVEKVELSKESTAASKPGSPPKKDVKLNSKSNVEFDIFWDNEKSVDSPAKEVLDQEVEKSKDKSKDDLNSTNESGEKRFIPRVLLNGSEQPTISQPTRVFTKFEVKSLRVGPKTPPDDNFNIFETNTLSNQSIPTPTQDESQNEKFTTASLACDSSNANSVRSLSPRSMQSDNSHQLNNQKQPANNHVAKVKNSSGKFEIYDPEAPLESPEQQATSTVYKSQPNSYNKSNFNIYNSSASNNNQKTNGDNSFAEMEIDSPFSPSKPINSPFQQQPKPSTSNISNPSTSQITGPDLKLVLDHLIKTAQLQQQKKVQSTSSPFKKSTAVTSAQPICQPAVDPYRNLAMMNNFISTDDDLPSSAVELNSREKYIKKLNRQERVVDEMKCCLKPYYQRKEITKEEYKDIMRKAVPKICHSKTGEINPTKISKLVDVYISRIKRERKK